MRVTLMVALGTTFLGLAVFVGILLSSAARPA